MNGNSVLFDKLPMKTLKHFAIGRFVTIRRHPGERSNTVLMDYDLRRRPASDVNRVICRSNSKQCNVLYAVRRRTR